MIAASIVECNHLHGAGKRKLVALLCLSSCCVVIIVLLSLTVSWVDLQFDIVVFPDQTRLFFLHQ